MPYSSESGKALIEKFIKRKLRWSCQPRNLAVLDVGVGAGTYSSKYRKLIKGAPGTLTSWIGIEIWEPYVDQFKLWDMYDMLMIEDVESALNKLGVVSLYDDHKKFDFIFIGDILEHLDRDKALRIVQAANCLLTDTGLMFCSVPIGDYPQGEYLGNPHEAHIDTWKTKEELAQLAGVRHVEQELEIGISISCDQESWNELMKPKIAVYMICKNEEDLIRRAVESAAETADEMVICDTGSTDKTVDTIRGLAWSYSNIKVHEIFISPWRFDDARNVSLSLVSPEVDFCVSLDADELLALGFVDQLRAYLQQHQEVTRVNHSFETYWNWKNTTENPHTSKHFHERIHARHGYRWVHPVHEKLSNLDERVGWCTDLLIRQLPDVSKNRTSYFPLLEQAVKEDPADWKLWSFFYQEMLFKGDRVSAAHALNEALKLPDSDKAYLYLRQGELYELEGNRSQARNSFVLAIETAPHMREVYVAAAEYHWRHHDLKAAYSAYIMARDCKDETKGYMRREDVWDARIEQQINKLSKELAEILP